MFVQRFSTYLCKKLRLGRCRIVDLEASESKAARMKISNRNTIIRIVLSIMAITIPAGAKAVAVFGDTPPFNNDQLLKTMIKQSFNNQRDVCYGGECPLNVLKSTIYSRLPLKTFNISKNIKTTCTGYILCSTMEEFKKLMPYLQPHRRVLAFPRKINLTTFDSYKFEKIYSTGLDLVIVQPLDRNTFKITYAIDNVIEMVTEKNVTMKNQKWDPERFLQRTGRKIVAGMFHCPPFVEVEGGKISGTEFGLLKEFTKRWPIEYRVLSPTNGSVRENLYITLYDQLTTKQIDLGICNLWLKTVVEEKFDYSTNMYTTCLTFLVHKPTLLPAAFFLFSPFQNATWALILFTFLVIAVVYKVAPRTPFSKEVLRHEEDGALEHFQGSRRLSLLALVVFGWLTSAYHSAGMSVSLNFPRYSHRYVKTLEDMVTYNIKWEEPDDHISVWLKNTNQSTCIAIANNWNASADEEEMSRNLRTGNYALPVSLTSTGTIDGADQIDEHGRTHLRSLSECLGLFYTATAFQKNSPFAFYFSKKLNLYLENDIMSYWVANTERKKKYRWMKELKSVYAGEQRIHRNLQMNNLEGIFYFLLLGHFCGLVCFVLEILSLNRDIFQYF